MTKKTVKRSLLASIVALVVSVSMLAGTTFAWFTDSVTSKNNVIKAGNLDVELEYAKVSNGTMSGWETVQGSDEIFDKNALWEPGRVEVAYLKVSNLGSLDLKYQLGVNFTNEVPGVNMAGKEFKLSDHLVFKAVELPDNFTPYTDREATVVASGTAQGIKDYSGATTPLAVDGVDYVALIVYMPETVGNEANYRGTEIPKIELGITLYATQVESEEDSYDDQYDKDAWVDGMKVNSANDLQDALTNAEAGDVIVLNNDINLTDGPIVIPAIENVSLTSSTAKTEVKPVVINLNGQTIANPNGYVIENYGNVVITGNGTFEGLGGIRSHSGSVTIENGNFYASSRWQDGVYQHTLKAENSTIVINGGNFDATEKGQTNAVLNASKGATITINGGNFKNVETELTQFDPYLFTYEKNGKVVINDGTFFGGWRFNGETSSTEIYGGNFTVGFDGQSFHANSTHKLVVYGGTFTPNTKYPNNSLSAKVEGALAKDYAVKDNGNGTFEAYFPQTSVENVIAGGTAGSTVDVPKGTYTFPSNKITEGVTLNCAEGTVFEGTSGLNLKNTTVIGATFKNEDGIAVRDTINGTYKNCVFEGEEALRWCYVTEGETVVFENCVIKTDFRGFHFDGLEGTVKFINCEINGFNAYGGEGKVIFEGCTFGTDARSSYNGLNIYSDTEIKNCTFKFKTGKTNFIDMEGVNKTLTIDNTVAFVDGVATNVTEYVGGSKIGSNKVVIDGFVYAFEGEGLIKALETESKVKLAKDITMNATLTNGYGATGVNVKAGQVLDGNGYTLTVNNANSTWDSAIGISGGTVKNITVANAFRGIFTGGTTADIKLDNVTFKNVIYTFNSDAGSKEFGVYVTNSTINGWTSFSNCHKEVVFTNCSFGKGSGYAFCRPYNKVLFKGCTFAEGYVIDKSQTSEITFEDCVGLN